MIWLFEAPWTAVMMPVLTVVAILIAAWVGREGE